MNLATYVLALAVTHRLMREGRFELAIAAVFIGCYKVNLVTNSLANEAIESASVSVFDNLDHVTLPADCSDDANLADTLAAAHVRIFVPMAILM